jgi:PhnB protein
MPINNLHPYIALDGSAADAIDLYQHVLGASVASLMHWRELPDSNFSESQGKRVMHSELRIGERTLSVADSAPGARCPETGNIQICLNFDEPDSLVRVFAGLSEGGTVVMPVHDSFWGSKFALLTDRFGVRWMLHCAIEAKAQ